jgi:hypothetical protein
MPVDLLELLAREVETFERCDAAGTGAVIRPDTVRRYADEAGFSSFEVLPIENDSWRFYLLRP